MNKKDREKLTKQPNDQGPFPEYTVNAVKDMQNYLKNHGLTVDDICISDEYDDISYPKHYRVPDDGDEVDGRDRYYVCGIQAEDVIAEVMQRVYERTDSAMAAWDVGNALKYLLRLGRKDDMGSELGKAENYLHHARTGKWITRVENDMDEKNALEELRMMSDRLLSEKEGEHGTD